MKEYERSFKAEDVGPYIDYCRNHGYKEVKVVEQNRVVYQNKLMEHVIARITTDLSGGKKKIIFDAKNINNKSISLKVSEESEPVEITEQMLSSINSLLKVMNFYVSADNLRTRYVYERGKVKFEIDKYTRPEMNIIAIEGDEEEVEKVFRELLIKR